MNNNLLSRSRRLRTIFRLAVPCLGTLMLGGCGSGPGVIFEPSSAGPSWPPLPDTPRIKYVGQLKSDTDLKAARTGLQELGDFIFGREATRGMVSPLAVCTDGGDRVFIADPGAQTIHVMNLQTRKYERWMPQEPASRLIQPVAVAYDRHKAQLLVSDSQTAQIVALDQEGKPAGILGQGILQRPCGLAVDADGKRIFVADAAAHQIVVLNEDGSENTRLGERGSQPGEFNFPTNVALDKAGRLYVSDSLNFRVQIFDADLKPVMTIGRKGDLPGYLSQPKGIALDSENHLYVVDANFEAVQLFDSEGRVLMSFGREGSGSGEFWLPAGMFIDSHDRVWIADSYNRRVQVFDYLPEGKQP